MIPTWLRIWGDEYTSFLYIYNSLLLASLLTTSSSSPSFRFFKGVSAVVPSGDAGRRDIKFSHYSCPTHQLCHRLSTHFMLPGGSKHDIKVTTGFWGRKKNLFPVKFNYYDNCEYTKAASDRARLRPLVVNMHHHTGEYNRGEQENEFLNARVTQPLK